MNNTTREVSIGFWVSALTVVLSVGCNGSSHSLGSQRQDGGGGWPALDAGTKPGGGIGGASGAGASTGAGTGGAGGPGGVSSTAGKTGSGGATGAGGKTGSGGATGTGGKSGTGGAGGGGGTSGGICGTAGGRVCAVGEFCDFTAGMCWIKDAVGVCSQIPQLCPLLDSPVYVCGCDGKTYVSDCDRQAAAVSKASDGQCPAGTGGVGGTGGSGGTGGEGGAGGSATDAGGALGKDVPTNPDGSPPECLSLPGGVCTTMVNGCASCPAGFYANPTRGGCDERYAWCCTKVAPAASDCSDNGGVCIANGAECPDKWTKTRTSCDTGSDSICCEPRDCPAFPQACVDIGGVCTPTRWNLCPIGMEIHALGDQLGCDANDSMAWCCVDAPPSTCSDSGGGMCVPGECPGCFEPVPDPSLTCEAGRSCCHDMCDS